MSIVAPNGTIRFLSGVPIDSNYENTLYFASLSAQTSYFEGLTPTHIMYSCTRVRDGVIRVNAVADTLLTCNYVMFQNQNFSSKWFYAFIDDVRYVNTSMTEIYYRIDEIQTWLFDVTLKQCFIERQHTTTDTVYTHTVGEDVGAPELKVQSTIGSAGFSDDYDAILFTSAQMVDGNWQTAPIRCVNNLLTMSLDTAEASGYILDGTVRSGAWVVLEGIIQSLIEGNYSDAIIGGIIMPSEFASTGEGSQAVDKNFNKSALRGTLDGYTPANNKMYNSPYCVLRIQMSDGQAVFLQPEFLDGNYITVRCIPVVSMTPELAVIPKNYKGQSLAYAEALSFTAFPQFSVAVDGYKAWVASGGLANAQLALSQVERSTSLANEEALTKGAWNAGKGVAKSVVGYKSGDASAVVSGVGDIGDTILDTEFTIRKNEQNLQFANENYDLQNAIAKTFPPTTKGQTVTSALASDMKIGFTIDKMTINYDNAKSIDNYFTMYGYKINSIGIPNIHARPHFTYVKTVDCKVVGNCSADAQRRIQDIYDSGIRFWVNASEVGDYTVDNSPA